MSRLHSRIYLHSLAVLVVVAVATSVLFAFGARGAIQREIAERMARHVAGLIGERFHDTTAVARRAEQLHADLDLDVTVRDLDGRLLVAAGSPLPPLSEAETAALRTGRVVTHPRPAWAAAAIVRDPGSGIALGTVEASTRRRFGFSRLLGPAVAGGVILLVVAVATRPLARWISRPVERLTEAARRLGDGDLGYRVSMPERRARWWRRRRGADELEELTRAFNEMADRVQRLLRGQTELLANISHELRSPLTRIRVALELVPVHGDNEARLRDVENDLAELDRLLEDVLATARLEATGLPARLGVVNARQMLAQLAERAAHDALVGGSAVRVADSSRVSLVADETLLRRALWNLIENAAKYGAPPVTLAVSRNGDRVALSVSDEGQGIPPQDRERVLTAFVRLDSAHTPVGDAAIPASFGLGLTLARRVAEVHGGRITIEPASVVDGRESGCRVTLEIPAGGPEHTVPSPAL